MIASAETNAPTGFSGVGGAYGDLTAAVLGNSMYNFTATYDALARVTDLKVVQGGTTRFDQTRTFDAAGNVSTANTTLTGGTDNQAFCYDEQYRLTAAASSGTVPCQTFTAGTLAAANYNQSFGYDNLGRLTSGPLGSYTYGNSAHVHGATAIGSAYTAAYDAAGNMTCRAPSSSTTCSGTQTGAQLAYNNEGELSNWQNQPSSPTSTAAFLYDGQGTRVAQQATSGGSTTTTAYIGNIEEDATTGGTTSKTTYYYADGWRFAMAVNGTFDYIATDGLGSTNVTLAANGGVVATKLYTPYGVGRYSFSTMPTDRGFTGQVADSTSGLDYYVARYYDPVAGQFSSADAFISGGGYDPWALSRYDYVEGNPVLRTDPTGRYQTCQCEDDASNVAQNTTPPPPVATLQPVASAKPLSFAKPVTDAIGNVLDWATSPGPQAVGQGAAGVLDAGWDMVVDSSPPGLLSDLGLPGPDLKDPFAKLSAAAGGDYSNSGNYQLGGATGRLIIGVGLFFTPSGAEADATQVPRITGFIAHAFAQRMGIRGDGGVSLRAIFDAVKNPTQVVEQANNRIKVIGKYATVVMEKDGTVVTNWPNNRFGKLRGWPWNS